jgi:hypothetical protein
MPARSDSRVSPARTNGIEMNAGTRIRRPCNSSFFKSGLVAREKNDLVESVALEQPDLSGAWKENYVHD